MKRMDRMLRSRVFACAAMMMALALLAAACGEQADEGAAVDEEPADPVAEEEPPEEAEDAEEPDEAPPAEMRSVSVRMDWFPSGYHSAFWVAREMGWYEEAGLDVEIVPGEGSNQVVQTVAGGDNEFGYASADAVVRGVAGGAEIVTVANVLKDSGACVVVRADDDIHEPEDLVGKHWAGNEFGLISSLFPAYLRAAGLDPETDVEITLGDYRTVQSAFLAGDFDVFQGLVYGEPVHFKVVNDLDTRCDLRYSDVGISVLGHGIITRDDIVGSDPELVAAFVEQSLRGVEYMFDNPAESVEIMLDGLGRSPDLLPAEALEGHVVLMEELITSEAGAGEPLGWNNEEEWQQTLDVMLEYADLEAAPDHDELYTNDFVPSD